ncbi:DnaJ subfamily member 1/2-like protein [Babesia gibsoni]|uniref:DnaJ subfamily member 1/2-like protein n=1 Tax=Babesia gibsoni TaxID=33632 RepID=A0AAD8LLL2_BABGI|nr:DnaJ subfamily member 1/2-like protein [Babesia gibsoni]
MKVGGALLLIALFRALLVESWSFFGDEPRYDPGEGKRCPYEVLGVQKSSSTKDIRKAFLTLSKKYHPDISKEEGAAEKYKEINESYEILSNSEKRKVYDESGYAGLLRLAQGGGADQEYDFGDVFANFFGFGGGRNREDAMTAEPLVYPLELPLEDLYLGRELEVKVFIQRLCKNYDECELQRQDCIDLGVRVVTMQHGPGMFLQQQVRDASCIGRGKAFKTNCKACPNGPTYKEEVTLDVTIIPGYKHGQQIVLKGRGQEKPGLRRGNVVFVIQQGSHPDYRREGDDLYRTLNITLKEALLGFTKEIDLFGTGIKIAQAGVTPHDHIIRVERSGMPRAEEGGFGDLYVVVNVMFPKFLTGTQVALIEQAL